MKPDTNYFSLKFFGKQTISHINAVAGSAIIGLKSKSAPMFAFGIFGSSLYRCPSRLIVIDDHRLFYSADYLKVIDGIFAKYGTMVSFWLGPRLYILLKDPKRIQSVLMSQECLNRDDVYEFINLLGDGGGLMTLKGDTWKAHRKFLNPCFSPRILQSYMPIFNEQSEIMMHNLQGKCGAGNFNFYESMDACTLDMICRESRWEFTITSARNY